MKAAWAAASTSTALSFIGVRTGPGATQFRVTPVPATSRAADLVSAATAPLLAAYPPRSGAPVEPSTEPIVTTRPYPAASMPGRTARIASHVPMTLVSRAARNSSADRSSTEPRARRPAAVTRPVTVPHRPAACLTTSASASGSVVSATSARLSGPYAFVRCCSASRHRSAERPVITTGRPLRATASAIARPIPLVPPVTSTGPFGPDASAPSAPASGVKVMR